MKRKRREGYRTLYTYSDWFHFKRGGRKRKLAHQKWTPLLFRLAVCDTQIDGPFDISMARVENFNLPLSDSGFCTWQAGNREFMNSLKYSVPRSVSIPKLAR